MENKTINAVDIIAYSQKLIAESRIKLELEDIEGAKDDLIAAYENLNMVVESVRVKHEEK